MIKKLIFLCLLLLIIAAVVVYLFLPDLYNSFLKRTKVADFFPGLLRPSMWETKIGKFPFEQGETIEYEVKLYGFKIGVSTLSFAGVAIKNKVKVAQVIFLTDVANLYDLENIYFDLNTFNPLWVTRDIDFFRNKEFIEEDYTKKPKLVLITKKKNSKQVIEEIASDESYQHVISSIYYYRKLEDLKIGKRISLNLPLNKLLLEVKRKEEIQVPAGKFLAYYIESVPKKFKIWLSCDKKRIPLRIEGAASLVPTAMVMTEYKGAGDGE